VQILDPAPRETNAISTSQQAGGRNQRQKNGPCRGGREFGFDLGEVAGLREQALVVRNDLPVDLRVDLADRRSQLVQRLRRRLHTSMDRS
jgi:hypothetical protein